MLRALVLALTVAAGTPVGADVQLLMIEQPGCACCTRWDGRARLSQDSRGPVRPPWSGCNQGPTPRTWHSAPPLSSRHLHPRPRRPGNPAGSRGYPGEDFFWGLMARMLADAGEDPGKAAPWRAGTGGANEPGRPAGPVTRPPQNSMRQHAAPRVTAEELTAQADEAAGYLRRSPTRRLMILCHLLDGEKSVTELESLLASRQAAVNQQLARLRFEGLVKATTRRKAFYYQLLERSEAARMIGLLDNSSVLLGQRRDWGTGPTARGEIMETIPPGVLAALAGLIGGAALGLAARLGGLLHAGRARSGRLRRRPATPATLGDRPRGLPSSAWPRPSASPRRRQPTNTRSPGAPPPRSSAD